MRNVGLLDGTISDARDEARNFASEWAKLRDKTITLTVKYNTVGGLIYTGVDKGERDRQFGGPVRANVPYLVGEAGH